MGKLGWAKGWLMTMVPAVLLVVSVTTLIHGCAPGPPGSPGPAGPPGPEGPAGLSDVQIIREVVEDDSDIKSATASCPPGKVAVGGGASAWPDRNTLAPPGAAIQASRPVGDGTVDVFGTPTGWFGAAHRVPGVGPPIVTWQLQVFAVCATVSP
jgi:hypothetical protein